MKQYSRLLLLVGGILSTAAFISAGQLSGPSFGYVWSSNDGKLHPLLGIPGSATIGNGLDLGFAISQARALDGHHFLASTDANPSLLSINLATLPPSVVSITQAPAGPSRIAGSRAGTSAALYYAAEQRVLIVTGLPSAPTVAYSIDVSRAGEALSHMGVSDDGSLLLYSVFQGERDALYGWTRITGDRLLTTADTISDIALTANNDAVVADSKANEIFLIANPKGSAARSSLADDKSGVANPMSIIVSNAGRIYVANGGSDMLLTLDSTGQVLGTQLCGCEVAGLFPLKDSLYRLSDRTDKTLYLLEAGTTGDRVVFVPPSLENQ